MPRTINIAGCFPNCCYECGLLHESGICPAKKIMHTKLELRATGTPTVLSSTSLPDIKWEANGFANEWDWFAVTLPNTHLVNGIANSNVANHTDVVDGIELLCEGWTFPDDFPNNMPTVNLAVYLSNGLHLNLFSKHAPNYSSPVCSGLNKGDFQANYVVGNTLTHGFCMEVDADIVLRLSTIPF